MDNELVRVLRQEAPKTTMTTKEIAEAFGVDISTVQRTAKKLFDPSEVLRRVINGGKTMVFTSEQATLLKEEISRHHNLKSREIDDVETQESIAKDIKKGMDALAKWNAILMKRRDELEAEVKELKPKADRLERLLDFPDRKGDAEKAVSFTRAAEILGIMRADFIKMLVLKRFVTRQALPGRGFYYKPAKKYKSLLFIRKPHTKEQNSSAQLLVTEEGVDFFGKILKAREEREIEGGRGDGK